MQTFLPYADFAESAAVLDYRRLGKQRVEVLQLLNALTGKSKGWANHPAAIMWRGYEPALAAYGNACIYEWVSRGYNNTMPYWAVGKLYELPWWLGDYDFHLSHMSNLLRKDPAWYSKWFTDVPDNLPYVWPARLTATRIAAS
jgi:hypothetical protein